MGKQSEFMFVHDLLPFMLTVIRRQHCISLAGHCGLQPNWDSFGL